MVEAFITHIFVKLSEAWLFNKIVDEGKKKLPHFNVAFWDW